MMETFINEVRKHPIVYDIKRMDYRDTKKKTLVWEKIREVVGMDDVQQCQKTWKSLRDRYVKELKQIEIHRKNDPTLPPKSGWEYFDLMGFYKTCGRPKRNDPFLSLKRKHVEEDETNTSVEVDGSTVTTDIQMTKAISDSSVSSLVADSTRSVSLQDDKSSKSDEYNEEKEINSHCGRKIDEAEHFSLSVAETLRRLPRQKMALAKIEISDILYKIEFNNCVP